MSPSPRPRSWTIPLGRRFARSLVVGVTLVLLLTSGATAIDGTRPTATLLAPVASRPVPRDALVRVRFSKAVIAVSSDSLTLTVDGRPIAGDVTYEAVTRTATLRPRRPLPAGAAVVVTAGGEIRDPAGNPLRPARWTLSIAAEPLRPSVASVSPGGGKLDVQPWSPIVIRLAKPIRSTAGIGVAPIAGPAVSAAVTLGPDRRTVTIRPTEHLEIGQAYRVMVPAAMVDPADRAAVPWTSTFLVTSEPVAHVGPAFTYPRDAVISAWHVPAVDLPLVATMGVTVIVKKFNRTDDPTTYLDEAAMVGVKVLVGFDYVYEDGSPDLAEARSLARSLKGHPALYGFLAATEPEAVGLTRAQLQGLYRAFKAGDPNAVVMLSLGNARLFPTWAPTHLGPGTADAVICEFYPVVSRSVENPDGWTSGSDRILQAWRATLDAVMPGTPVWGSIAVHTYRPGERRSPSLAEMADEARDQFRYTDAVGLSVYPWNTPSYLDDLRRDPTRQAWFTELVNAIRAGTL